MLTIFKNNNSPKKQNLTNYSHCPVKIHILTCIFINIVHILTYIIFWSSSLVVRAHTI